jgi:hypothetical protein
MNAFTIVTRTAVFAATGCAVLGLAGPAAADEDIFTGGAFCSQTGPTCDPTSPTFTAPAGATQVKFDFTQNPNDCGTNLTVSIRGDDGTAYPLGQNVATTPGAHVIHVTPSCGQVMASWGGVIHATYTLGGGETTGTPQTVTILQPSTIYNADNGTPYKKGGNEVFKPTGATVQLVGPEFCQADDWCHIDGKPEEAGTSWIYGGVDQNGKPFIQRN